MRTRASILVGRDTELRALEKALSAARSGRGQAVFLVGEAGIGKSRLAMEAENLAFTAGMRLLRGRSSAIGPTVPFRPLTEALMSLLRSGDVPEAAALGPYRPVLGRLVPDWSDGPSEQDSDFLIILAEALIRLTGIIGRERGCLLVLDDLQDADPETLAVVEYVVDNLDRGPTLLLGTIRNEPSAALDLARSTAQRRACALIELDRLDQDQVRELAGSCIDGTADDVPTPVIERLWAGSAGNPFIVEELLNGMVGSRLLVPGADGWRVVGEIRADLPVTLARSISRRADQLGVEGRRMLSAAAVLGRRFPLAVVQAVTGLDDRTLLSHLHAGLDLQLVGSDDQAPDWYAFQHPLTAEALLTQLAPGDRADLARRSADAVARLYPGLPGEWCQLVAALRVAAGEEAVAARLFAEAGRRAVAQGAANSAVALLDRARGLLEDTEDAAAPEALAEVLELQLYALAEAGLVERALALANRLDQMSGGRLDARRRAELHTRIAWAANVAGRVGESLAQVEAARQLLGPDAREEDLAPVDAVAAYLTLELPGRDRVRAAETLARRTAAVAESVPLPVVACQAWLLVGVLARQRDLNESTACFERVCQLASEHQLPIWEIHALVRLGGNDAILDGDLGRLELALEAAVRAGAVTASSDAEANLAFQSVLRGDFDQAESRIDHCLSVVERLHLADTAQYMLLTRAMLAAHRGKRRDMERALADFRRWGGDQSHHPPLGYGLARAFCALLEEDRERAHADLARARALEDENPTIFYMAGRWGIALLLGMLAGTVDRAGYEAVAATPAGRLRWNRQFVLLAEAVQYGRSGQADKATAAVAAAREAAEPYEMARHLGLRLVAEAAQADGWGDPVDWLIEAEEYFHRAGVPAVATACRGLLRRAGASVRQRRDGSERVPPSLRSAGVTIREYEVLELLVDRLSNRAIADRLHISPRTAEKHVASLIMKTGQPDRGTLCAAAPAMLSE
jgi:ATP/maltotriose-dependent transcriptional regulator MalT